MRGVLKQVQKVGTLAQKAPRDVPMYENGYRALGPDMYVPTPGRVQYYRAETLPFVPVEIKTQLRFPKAFAQSVENMRYLDKVT